MIFKGFDKFREKTPSLRGVRIIIVPIFIYLVALGTSYVLTSFYSYPQKLNQGSIFFASLFPLFGVLLVELIGFLLFSQLWMWRDKFKSKYGLTSYQRIFFVGISGITIIISLAFNLFTPIQNYSPVFWQNSDVSFLVKPFYILFGGGLKDSIHILLIIFGLGHLILGLSLSIRSIITFGVDYTTAIYIYFPEESVVQENRIYSVLRHPMYAGAVFAAFGGFVYNLTIYSFIFFLMYIIGFYIHIHFVEEPELISRFGESYENYRKSVPLFFINPIDLPKLLKFIIKG